MCSFFGEVNIPSSRAFWDDCDEDDPSPSTVVDKLKLKYDETGHGDSIPNTDLFLLVEGVGIRDFAEKTLLEQATKICTIPTDKSGSGLYSIQSHNMLVGVLEEDLSHSGEIMSLLLPYVKQAKNVITLTIKRKVDYKSEKIMEFKEVITFLRGINSKLSIVKELEAPNFIAGVAAGIAAWCDNEKLSVSSYVAYTDEAGLDTLSTQPILKMLQALGVNCATSYTRKLKDDSWLYS